MLSLLLGFLILAPPAGYLGNSGSYELYVVVDYHDTSVDMDGTQGDCILHFQRRLRGKVTDTKDFDAGASQGPAVQFEIGNFLGKDRRQVFISVRFGRVATHLLDYDGKRIRVLYGRTEGRVSVTATPHGSGRCEITEFWSKPQYWAFFGRKGRPDKNAFIERRFIVGP
jgi:hypothetical protein